MPDIADEETTSPGRPMDALKVGWFCVTVMGVVVPQAFVAPVIAMIVLIGGCLIAHEKAERYPTLDWPSAARRYRREHTWSRSGLLVLAAVAIGGVALGDADGRGVCLLTISAYYFFWLATPLTPPALHTRDSDTPCPDDRSC